MSSAKKIAKNTAFLFGAEVVEKLLSFVLVIIITRYLGSEGFGMYSFAFAFIMLFSILANLGLSVYMSREIPKYKKGSNKIQKLVSSIISMEFVIMVLVLSISLVIARIWPSSNKIFIVIVLVAFYELFNVMNALLKTIFSSYEKNIFKLYSISFEKIIAISLVLVVFFKGYGLIGLMLALLISKIFTTLLNFYWLGKHFLKPYLNWDVKYFLSILKKSIPFWIGLVFIIFYYEIDKVMLSAFKGFQVNGWYSAAVTLVNALVFIPVIFIHATFPAMVKFFQKKNKKMLLVLFNKTLYYLVLIAIPISVGIIMLSHRLIQFIYKEQFYESGIALKILAFVIVFVFMNSMIGYLLNSVGKEKYYSAANVIATVSNIIFNLVLIPLYSYIGAAIATILSQLVGFVLLYYFSVREGYSIKLGRLFFKPIISSGIMSGFIFIFFFLPIWYLVPLAAIVFFGSLYLFRGINKEELNLFVSLFKN